VNTPSAPRRDADFLHAFECGKLPRAQFDHAGHLRIACLMLQRYPPDEAVQRTCSGIQRLAAHFGAPDKFHHTVTEALVRWMAHHGAAHMPWADFLSAHPELTRDAPALLARHYSEQRLSDPQARRTFLDPDREPLHR
jgi:hypothetical protein